MNALVAAQKKWQDINGLEKTINNLQNIIDSTSRARDELINGLSQGHSTITNLQDSNKTSFDRINKDAKDLHVAITHYGKVLDKKFKGTKLPQANVDPLASYTQLTNRAIGMHLLREGLFDIAKIFISEASTNFDQEDEFWNIPARKKIINNDNDNNDNSDGQLNMMKNDDNDNDDESQNIQTSSTTFSTINLESKFEEMYKLVNSLQNDKSLDDAIKWSRDNSQLLEDRGSILEFELVRLKFITIFLDDTQSTMQTLEYARATFPKFTARFLPQISTLLTSLIYSSNIDKSPYKILFENDKIWSEMAINLKREYCGLLGLSETSPLYTAITAGGLIMPILEKLERVMEESGGQWTSANELPVETPLPSSYLFHSIFVCPVSKEQSTDNNPPMMIPCGHVLAKNSMEKISRSNKRFKCPYCPNESYPRDAKKVYL